MRHFWVFETLLDLRAYAKTHGFVKLSAKVDEAIVMANLEIDPMEGRDATKGRAQP